MTSSSQGTDDEDGAVPGQTEIAQDEAELERNGERIRRLFDGSGS